MIQARKRGSKRGGLMAALITAAIPLALAGCGQSARAGPGLKTAPSPLFVGFYDAWDQGDLPALPRQLKGLSVFSPRWLTIRGPQGQVVVEPDAQAEKLAKNAAPRLKLAPLVSNAHDDIWDQAAADAVILDPKAQKAFLADLVRIAQAKGYDGYVLDFENLSPRAAAGYPALLAAARAALGPSGREAWATVAPGPDEPLKALAASGDAAVLMAYDECWATSNAGPVAGADWLRRLLADRLRGVDPRKVVIALAAYGYDWPDGQAGKPIGAAAAMDLARRMKVQVLRDRASGNAHFAYAAADGHPHQVWFVDASAFAADRAAASAFNPRGYAVWRLGMEDPALWSLPPAPHGGGKAGPTTGPAPHPCNLLKS
jgi:spore germination protein YaaH